MSLESLNHRVGIARHACAQVLAAATARYRYPWSNLEEDLEQSGKRSLRLVGYGSLLNPKSARRAIINTPEDGHPPVLAFGARRIFNYIMPDSLFAGRGEAIPVVYRAALNVVWTGRVDDVLNGRLIDVLPCDFLALREREQGYHLDPVAWVPWDSPQTPPEIAFILRADETPWNDRVVVDPDILPNAGYLDLCRYGARCVDTPFEEAFLTTTWLADGRTRLDQYLSSIGQEGG